MTREETWETLIRLGVVQGKISKGRWNLREADLDSADLASANLSRANLSRADLRGANLREANLCSANLREADLCGANLSEANLNRADLVFANLSEADLFLTDLRGADLFGAHLVLADLSRADLRGANLDGVGFHRANLSEANLNGVDLHGIDFSEANLNRADLSWANLSWANLSRTDLSGADCSYTLLNGSNLEKAKLNDCKIYGISAWDLNLEEAEQSNLIITPKNESIITVDNLKIAQFLYLLLNNSEIREVLDSIVMKVVLILGRFKMERLSLLDALRNELRRRNYIPILFDFEGPRRRDITETIRILAHMARFVIADITDAKSIPQELMAIVPNLPSVPVQPLLQMTDEEYGMFEHFKRFSWVLPMFRYKDINEVLASLSKKIISPAESMLKKQEKRGKNKIKSKFNVHVNRSQTIRRD